MTRFNLKTTGLSVGVTFAGDNGRTRHLTVQEETLLWSVAETTELDFNEFCIETVGELLDFMYKKSVKASREEVIKRFDTTGSLNFNIKLTDKGTLITR